MTIIPLIFHIVYLTLHIQILVYAESDEALEFAKTQMPVVMGRTVSIHVPQCLACVVQIHIV